MLKIISIEPKENYMLFVKLSSGKEGMFDVSPYLEKGIFGELKNTGYFKLARITFSGISWPNCQDFSADTIDYEMKPIN